MRLKSFQIKNFRSIVDSGICELSHEGIAVLVGQNEAGKSAVLDALVAWQSTEVHPDDLRNDGSLPIVICNYEVSQEAMAKWRIKSLNTTVDKLLPAQKFLQIGWRGEWSAAKGFEYETDLSELKAAIEPAIHHARDADIDEVDKAIILSDNADEVSHLEDKKAKLIAQKLSTAIDEADQEFASLTPEFILFKDDATLLPSTIDVVDKKLAKGQGHEGASNFLRVAGIDLAALLELSGRQQETRLASANRIVTELFRKFWTQTVGKKQKLELVCQLKNYPESLGDEKRGKAYLVFFISDSDDKLHPNQRSQGVRWYVSFFLQICATAKSAEQVVLLLDEPGANLHAKAQLDVLRVIEASRGKNQVIYSTHSPDLVRTDRLGRVLAVQRVDQEDESSPTVIIGAHRLSSASMDTLSAVYRAMGIDFSRQQVIQKTNNILLEELSALYYMKAFWSLAKSPNVPNFLPATGVTNIPMLANLLTGWGIEFIVAVDDDKQARGIRDELSENLFLGDKTLVESRFYRLTGCQGIEDVFDSEDFHKHILCRTELPAKPKLNSDIARTESKGLLAYQFCTRVESGEISHGDLSKATLGHIVKIVSQLDELLENYPR